MALAVEPKHKASDNQSMKVKEAGQGGCGVVDSMGQTVTIMRCHVRGMLFLRKLKRGAELSEGAV